MSTWQHLIQSATLGLNRSPFTEEPEEEWLSQLELPDEVEARFLQLAGTLALARKAGFQPEKLSEKPEIPIPQPETKAYISSGAAQSLSRILNGSSKELFAEIVSLTLNAGKIIPPEYLPKLFQWAIHSKMISETILSISGNRGEWLANLHPDWKIFLPPNKEQWEAGKFDERLAYFAWKRRKSPEEALELLLSVHKEETPQNLAKLIDILHIHLSENDLAFLESLENHRRKEVRKAVRNLLLKIRGSQIAERIKDRLVEVISLKKGLLKDSFEVNPIDQIDDELQKDGINGSVSSGVKLGKRASILGQMMASVSPDIWTDHFDLSPDSLLKLFVRNEWGEALIYGIGQATLNYQNPHWAAAIIRQLTEDGKAEEIKRVESVLKPQLPGILHLVESGELNQILFQAIKPIRHPDHNLNGIFLLEHLRTPIQPQTAMLYAQKVMGLLTHFGNRVDYKFRSFVYELSKTVYCFPPEMYSQIANLWGLNPYETNWYDPHVERALQLLQLRHRMKSEI